MLDIFTITNIFIPGRFMDTQPAFGLKELLAHIIGDIAKAVSERDGECRAPTDFGVTATRF